ncbi:odorant receptor 46a-like [Leptopilina heterotoma]|uniref:odorant receptor 46a-like n=1 Tax=Leptopilina heterotoma TaxID=63436 RepID=UPI001CA86C1E|nr:odorant receptor 46a-like [Leptopilina heterotoma]
MKLDNLGETFAILSFNIGQIFRLFCLTLPSQRLIDQSNQLTQNIYDSYWYTLPSDSRNLLKTVMLKCIKPNTFTAGKLYCFSMSNFGSVIKTSLSYFTVLVSIRE